MVVNNDEAEAEAEAEAVPDSVAVPMPTQAAGNNREAHPVIRMMQEKEVGKAVMGFAIPIAMGIIVSVGKDKDAEPEMSMSFVLLLLCVGFAAILNGILLKETFPELAQIAEAVGICVAVTGFFVVIAVYLPAWGSWVPALCIGGCLLPFGIAVWQRQPN